MFYNHVMNVNTIKFADGYKDKVHPIVTMASISLMSALIVSVVIVLPVLIGLKFIGVI